LEGYKLKYRLITYISCENDNNPSSMHAGKYEITLFITPGAKKFMPFYEIEAIIAEILEPYSGKCLAKTSPFDEMEPTLKNLGDTFYHLLKDALTRHDLILNMLEISESPLHTYMVNDTGNDGHILVGDKKIKISGLIMENITAQSTSRLLAAHEMEEEPESTPPVYEPAGEEVEEEPQEVLPEQKKRNTYHPVPLKRAPVYQFVLGLFFLIAAGALLAFYLKNTGAYPSGSDIYGHLFKSDLLYKSIRSGNFYPLYTELWYNGMQPFRYWAPMPYYLMALLQFIAGGDVVSAYLLFVFFAFVIGGTGWLLWGMTYNRMLLASFFGAMWFFLPDNIRVFFVEGNFPRMFIAILLPYLFYFVWRFVDNQKKWSVIPVILIMCCITLSHVMIAAMTGIASFLFLLIYCIIQRQWKSSVQVILAMLISFAICGIWLYPALKGGLVAMDAGATAEVMESLSTPISISLNPLVRVKGIFDYYYFGLAVMVVSIFGIIAAGKKSLPGFITVILIFLGTTTVAVSLLKMLPFNQLLWMMRFTPIVYALFIISVLEWRNCRRYAAIIFAAVLLIDSIPSAHLERYFSQNPTKLYDSLSIAKEITNQRVSLIDLSVFDSYPSYYFSGMGPETRYTFGWAWQGASTASNIVMLNTAAERGYYYYLFDRSLELGDDTVMFQKELLKKAKKYPYELIEAAEASGYRLYKETNYTYIFHRDTPDRFGVETEYKGLAIGNSAKAIALIYPSFAEGKSDNLSDYGFEELIGYKVIYLSNFRYNDRTAVEELLTRAANEGVKIIIDMGRIPVDPVTSRMSFFGVTAQAITFNDRYPELIYKNRVFEALPFKEEYSTWNAVYLDNVKEIIGYSWFNNKELPFLGTAGNPNILFMGYNILFHAMETRDEAITDMINDFLEVSPDRLPKRKVVPISVEMQKDRLVIDTAGGEINTTIAYQDNFLSSQKILNENNLLVVQEPHTEIEITYAHLIPGIILSGLGLLGANIFLYFINRKKRCTI